MSQESRIERDSLGAIAVPKNAYWGVQTQRAIENYPISGLRTDPALIDALAVIKQAAARVFGSLGMLSPEKADAIDRAAQEVRDGEWDDQIVVDAFQAGAGTSLHMNVNEVIANRANLLMGEELGSYAAIHPNDHVNKGQSTNDVIPTAMRLAALELAEVLDASLEELQSVLCGKAVQFDRVVKAGRTHLQDAVPIRLGQEFDAYASAVARARKNLWAAAEDLKVLGIGGSAVGTGLNTPSEYRQKILGELRQLTGHDDLRATDDYFEAMQSMAVFTALSGALRNLAIELGRIANDLRLMSSGPRTGLHELVLPSVQPGSSIMPGKINPSVPEMLNQVCFQVIGCDATVAAAAQAGQLELNVMMPVIAYNLLLAERILANAVDVFTDRCVEGIEADVARCKAYADTSVGLATVLNPVIGYAAAAEVVKEAVAKGLPIPAVVKARSLLSEDQVGRVFSTPALTEPYTL
ncbi:aspartate ammonia-lyase [bacterium]|nr:aspartate ammonia-lyase [bacterium]